MQESPQQLKRHQVSAEEIAKDTSRNPLLAKALLLTQNGWPINRCNDPDLKPYFTRRHELSVEQGCFMWGLRTVITPSLRQTILTELHEWWIARIKSIARSHVWWSKIDQEIEKVTREFQPCNKTRRAPPALPLLPWSWPTAPWQRVHVDFATHQGKHYLIMVDAHSKWPEVIGPMKTTTAHSTISAMRNIFFQIRFINPCSQRQRPTLPACRVWRVPAAKWHSENFSLPLPSLFKWVGWAVFADFQVCNGVISWRCRKLYTATDSHVLLSYRSTPHAITGSSPAKLFLQRELRTRLSLVTRDIESLVASRQDKMKCNHDKFAKFREIAVGDCVLARDHLSRQKWQAGTVVQQTASSQVQLNDGRNWRRHVDDVLQNTPSSAVTHSSSVEVTSDQSTEGVTSPSIESRTPPPEESESVESPSTPTPPTPAPRRSKRATKPPQRLIEEMG